MPNNYTDRDYFDEKFRNIDVRFDSLNKKLDKLHKSVYGNGEKGLVEKMRDTEENITKLSNYVKATIIFLVALIPFEIEEVRLWLFRIISSMF
jgi:hypothetical protein